MFIFTKGKLFGIDILIYSDGFSEELKLDINREFFKSFTSFNQVKWYFKSTFKYYYLRNIDDVEYKNTYRNFLKNGDNLYRQSNTIRGFYIKNKSLITKFANHFNKFGTLNYDCFTIGKYEFSLINYRKVITPRLTNSEYFSLRDTALIIRGGDVAYNLFEDIYSVLEFRLDELFNKLKALEYDNNHIQYKFVRITMKEQ